MKKDIYIVGASGFGREVAYLIEGLGEYTVAGFIDDNKAMQGSRILDYDIVGTSDFLLNMKETTNVVIAIGNPEIRKMLSVKLSVNDNIKFPNLISRDVRIHESVHMGKGNIICQGTVLTVDITLGNFNHVNLNNTVGHDAVIHNYVTVYPGCNISGNVTVFDKVELGTGSKVIQGKNITNDVVVGAGSVIVKDITESGVYVGVPVKKIK